MMTQLLKLLPEYRDYVWGGQRLRPGTLTAEAWIVYENDQIADGPLAGGTLADAARQLGPALLGERAYRQTGDRFPLLIKLLDCNEWLSVQVHPNDEQAVQLAGPDHFGKTEAWHVLEAQPGAQLIAGVRDGTTAAALAAAIRNGTVVDLAEYHHIRQGDTVFVPAGTLHALGPGSLIYEVQQTSDITYRIFDWNRPASAGRPLHIEQSIIVTNPRASGQLRHAPKLASNESQPVVSCPYFTLELMTAQTAPLLLDTHGESFHAVTVIEGQAELRCGAERATLKQYETMLVPASAGTYQLHPLGKGGCRALKAGVGAV
jgi:mannose-6-phosphate isomerase